MYPGMVHLLAYHQVLCYCSLAKPNSHPKSKNLHGFLRLHYSFELLLWTCRNQCIPSLFTLILVCAPWSSVTPGSGNLVYSSSKPGLTCMVLVINCLLAVDGSRGTRFRKALFADCNIMIPDKGVCQQHWTCLYSLYGERRDLES